MKWYRATVYERVQVGTDATKNPVCELRATDTAILVRTAPMAPRHDATEGNQFDIVERTFLTKARRELLENAAGLEVGGVLYEIGRISEWGDPVALLVKRSK